MNDGGLVKKLSLWANSNNEDKNVLLQKLGDSCANGQ